MVNTIFCLSLSLSFHILARAHTNTTTVDENKWIVGGSVFFMLEQPCFNVTLEKRLSYFNENLSTLRFHKYIGL